MPAPENQCIRIHFNHPNARNAESFLNSWQESFILEKTEGNCLSFRPASSDIRVRVFFFDSYQEGVDYERKHSNRERTTEKWTMNGSALYVISGTDPGLVRSLAGHFAGRE